MEYLFIVNPVAGKGRALRFVSRIRNAAKAATSDFSIKITRYPGHATEIAREHAEKGVPFIYSVGGDGTLNEVLNGMAGTRSQLGVIPAGSGNDFSRSIYDNTETDRIIHEILKGSPRPVDMVRLNKKYFINISSMGFDAEVAYKANVFKKKPLIPAGLSYYLGILAVLARCQSYKMRITIDGRKIQGDILLAAVANGRYYGKGILPAPLARIDDGILDICIVERKSRHEILWLFPRYAAGRHEGIEGVSFHRGRNIHIECEAPVAVNLDGEVEYHSELVYEIVPKGINLIVP